MISSRMSKIIYEAYGRRYGLQPGTVPLSSNYSRITKGIKSLGSLEAINRMLKPYRTRLTLAGVLTLLFLKAAITVYYYNTLVDMQQNMLAARGDVQALVQRRNDIAVNLSKAVLDYSRHEQGVFTAVTGLRKFFGENRSLDSQAELEAYVREIRAGAEKAVGGDADGRGLMEALSKLVAVAEQYPDLKLSANFETLMAALVQVEQDLAGQRIAFNQEANMYTTVFTKFPGNFFAWVFGFKPVAYFEADDQAKAFRVIGY